MHWVAALTYYHLGKYEEASRAIQKAVDNDSLLFGKYATPQDVKTKLRSDQQLINAALNKQQQQEQAARDAEQARKQKALAEKAAAQAAQTARAEVAYHQAEVAAEYRARQDFIASLHGDFKSVAIQEHGSRPCHVSSYSNADGLSVTTWYYCWYDHPYPSAARVIYVFHGANLYSTEKP